MGEGIPNEDWVYQDGDVGYVIRYDDSSEICYVGYDELERYVVVSEGAAKSSTTPSETETKAYCKPKEQWPGRR